MLAEAAALWFQTLVSLIPGWQQSRLNRPTNSLVSSSAVSIIGKGLENYRLRKVLCLRISSGEKLYRLIWDCVPFLSPLTALRDYGGGILTCLHTGKSEIFLLYHIQEFSLYLTGITLRHSNTPPHGEEWDLSNISYIGIQFLPHRNRITSF
jgi:hypothetical protein